jgi:signal transduction histidine kinase
VRALDTVRTQVERFGGSGTLAELHLGEGVDERRWSPEVARSVQRLVQEGLTNVRKHARTATSVCVSIEQDDGRLLVRVRDDGARRGRPRFRSSGFGLVGLSERVAALGGELHGGPVEGGGWLLAASLPGAVAR